MVWRLEVVEGPGWRQAGYWPTVQLLLHCPASPALACLEAELSWLVLVAATTRPLHQLGHTTLLSWEPVTLTHRCPLPTQEPPPASPTPVLSTPPALAAGCPPAGGWGQVARCTVWPPLVLPAASTPPSVLAVLGRAPPWPPLSPSFKFQEHTCSWFTAPRPANTTTSHQHMVPACPPSSSIHQHTAAWSSIHHHDWPPVAWPAGTRCGLARGRKLIVWLVTTLSHQWSPGLVLGPGTSVNSVYYWSQPGWAERAHTYTGQTPPASI